LRQRQITYKSALTNTTHETHYLKVSPIPMVYVPRSIKRTCLHSWCHIFSITYEWRFRLREQFSVKTRLQY